MDQHRVSLRELFFVLTVAGVFCWVNTLPRQAYLTFPSGGRAPTYEYLGWPVAVWDLRDAPASERFDLVGLLINAAVLLVGCWAVLRGRQLLRNALRRIRWERKMLRSLRTPYLVIRPRRARTGQGDPAPLSEGAER